VSPVGLREPFRLLPALQAVIRCGVQSLPFLTVISTPVPVQLDEEHD
jgi:hypothetical protein